MVNPVVTIDTVAATGINDATVTRTAAVRRIIFIDPAVPGAQTLLTGVAPDVVAILLDPDKDGVRQIADFLAANALSDLTAIQIVSHGSEGSITLGSTVLDNGNVVSFADALAQIGAALASGGDVMLYGCDVAAGTAGQQFLNALASPTGADVAASTDLTGAAALGGDWILEASTGPIEAAPAFTAAAESNFNALLAAGNELISVSSAEVQGNGVSSTGSGGTQSAATNNIPTDTNQLRSSISADGRYVVLVSDATNLVAGDTNGLRDVFLRDRVAGTTTLVSVSDGEAQALGPSFTASVSDSGNLVVFASNATNLVAGDFNDTITDIYLRNISAGTTQKISVGTGAVGASGSSEYAAISGNGQFVVFESTASDLVTGQTDINQAPDVYLRNLTTNTTIRVSMPTGGPAANGGGGFSADISSDGRWVVYESGASDLVAGDTNGKRDIFLYDRVNNTTTRVSLTDADGEATGGTNGSMTASVSDDGNIIAFVSDMTNLMASDPNGTVLDIFVRNVSAGTTIRIPTPPGLNSNALSQHPSVSGDGHTVIFSNSNQIWAYDVQTGKLVAQAIPTNGVPSSAIVTRPFISGDGSTIVFQSSSTNLVASDTNGVQDVFVSAVDFNQAPVVNIPKPPVNGTSVLESPFFVEGGPPVVLDTGGLAATITDPDNPANLNGGSLTLSITANKDAAHDLLGISTGTAAAITLSSGINVGSHVSVGGVDIGTITTSGTGNDLAVSFNANATLSLVSSLLQSMTFFNDATNPTLGQRTVHVAVTDGLGGTGNGDFFVRMDDNPTLTGLASSVAFQQADVVGTAQILDSDVTLSDVEGNWVNQDQALNGRLIVSGLLPEDVVSIKSEGSISVNGTGGVSFNGTSIGQITGGVGEDFQLRLNQNVTTAALEAVIEHLSYANTSAGTPTATRTLHINVVDSAGGQTGFVGLDSFGAEKTAGGNPFAAVNAGTNSAPVFADVDGDKDLDLVVGTGDGHLLYFRNDGGTFTQLTGAQNPFDAVSVGTNAKAVFVDKDRALLAQQDGDLDLYVGAGDGTFHFFRNDAGVFTEQTGPLGNALDGVDLGNNAAPAADTFSFPTSPGPRDLAVGFSGVAGEDFTVQYMGNNNSLGWSQPILDGNKFNFINLAGSVPVFADIDGDGDGDLVVGTSSGELFVYRQNGSNLTTTFSFFSSAATNPFASIDVGTNAAPAFFDVDGDGDKDLVVGSADGTIRVFENTTPARGQAITVNITTNARPTLDLDADDSNTVGTGFATSFTEGNAGVLISDTDVAIADAEGDNIESATISVQGPVAGDQLILGPLGAGFAVTGSGTATLTITGTGTATQYQDFIKQVTLLNASEDPTAGGATTRLINSVVNDGTSNSLAAVTTVTITGVNDEPTLAATAVNPAFTEGDGSPADIFSTVTASTVESGQTFSSMTLTVTNVTSSQEFVRINNIPLLLTDGNSTGLGAGFGTAAVGLSGTTATVTITGATLTSTQMTTLIDGLGYSNNSQDPSAGSRVVTITQLVDSGLNGGQDDNTATPNVASTVTVVPVNDEPALTATAVNPTFTEGNASPADIFTAPIVASTVETGQTFTSMTVRVTGVIDGATQGADEILNFDGSAVALTNGNAVTTATNGLNVSVSITGATAFVTFSGAALDATQLQTLVDGLSYQNDSQIPTGGSRVMTITQLVDSGSNVAPNDNIATPNTTSTITVVPVNDEPTLTATAANATFTEGNPSPADIFTLPIVASTIEPGQTFASMTLTVTNVTDRASEVISINGVDVQLTDLNSINVGAGTASVSLSGGTATVTLSGATLSPSALSTLIDGLAYRNDSDNPTDADRVVTITQLVDSGLNTPSNDNTNDTLNVSSTVNVDPVNDAPIVSIAPTGTYTENDPGTLIDGLLNVTDPDSATLTGATVTITDAVTGDELRTNGSLSGTLASGIDFSFSGNTLTLSNAATVQDYRDALRLVSFDSTSENPTVFDTDTVRTISWQATDGLTSNSFASTDVTITPTNDQPDVDAPNRLGGPPNTTITIRNVTFSDIDGGDFGQVETATFNAAAGSFTADHNDPNVTVDDTDPQHLTLTGSLAALNAYIVAGSLTYSTPQLETISVTLDDLGNTGGVSLTDTALIDIVLNAAPTVTAGNTIGYTERAAPVFVDDQLDLDDTDGTTLDGATLALSPNSVSGDVLLIGEETSGDVGSIHFEFANATLTLTGTDTIANYESLLRTVTFSSTSHNPTNSGGAPSRDITWVVNDGIDDSAPATTHIDITAINEAPVLFDIPSTAEGTYTENSPPLLLIGFNNFSPDLSDIDTPLGDLGGTVTITDALPGDLLASQSPAQSDVGFSYTFTSGPGVTGTGVLTFHGLSNSADFNSFLSLLRFTSFSDDPTNGGANPTRNLVFTVTDGDLTTAPVTMSLTINAVNDAPVISLPGTPDLVTANNNSSDATVLLGNGAGSFAPLPPNPVGVAPNAVVLGDLNGDGKLDMVTANNAGDVSVLLGDGLGGFGTQTSFLVGDAPKDVRLGDLNGDGKLDIVTANQLTDDVSVLLGDGAGGFGLATSFSAGFAPTSVAVGDINGDGKLDIVTTNPQIGAVSTLLGDGTGNFALPTQISAGPGPFGVELGDINGDGRLDVVVANPPARGFGNAVVALVNFGGGSFAFQQVPFTDALDSIALGDINGDNILDIVAGIGSGATSAISVQLGTGIIGTGSPPFVTQPLLPIPETPSAVALSDVNGDGRLDIITSHSDTNTFSVLLNNGGGSFTTLPPQPIGAGGGPVVLALGNLDNAQVVDEDTNLAIGGIAIADPDANVNAVTTTLSADHGTLTLTNVIGGAAVTSNGTSAVTLNGTVAQINATLAATVVYRGLQDYNGPDTITIVTNDNGHTGTGGSLSATGAVPVNVAPVNDAPVNALPATFNVAANTTAALAGISVADPDAESGTMTTTLSVGHGTLSAASVGGAVLSGNGTTTLALTGTLAEINATLTAAGNLTYHGDHDFFGIDTLTMGSDDGGNTGSGGALTDTDSAAISVNTLINGTAGSDSFVASAGNGKIVGGAGIDTVTFGFRLVDATVTYSGNLIIIDGPGSHTVLSGLEVFNFTDGTVNNNDGNPLVDDLFYYSRYHDVWNAHADADVHYANNGWHEGRDPNAFFSTLLYLSANPDVKAASVNPLTQHDTVGWTEHRIPSLAFDGDAYLSANPDVAAAHVDPLAHFLQFGVGEGRLPFAPTELVTQSGFDYVYYLQHNPDVATAGVDPFQHFETFGWKEGRNPNALFDVNGYLANYADVAAAHVNPLDHYNEFGWHEGRDPSVNFDTTSYLAAYADVAASHINPLAHFLQFGIHEGRSAFADGVWG